MSDKLAFVFPGQGSQSVGMLSDLAETFSGVGDVFSIASDVLGYDLLSLCENGPQEKLNRTENTQPALLASSYAIWQVWQEQNGTTPDMLAGHSLGEYSALVCAGVLEFSDAIALVRDRGLYMQAAAPEGQGAMAAILGLDDQKVIEVCNEGSGSDILSAANFNSPAQVVIAGHVGAVERAIALARAAGAKRALLLPISVPSHCRLMLPAAEKLTERLGGISFKPAKIPVVQNVDARLRFDPEAIRRALIAQLQEPVLWSKTISTMVQSGVSSIIECGPGKVLSGLCKRIDRGILSTSLSNSSSITAALQAYHDA